MGARSPSDIRVGLIGHGIQHSRSPALHMDEASAQRIQLTYSLFDLDAKPWRRATLQEALEAAEADGFSGVNITFPFKQTVVDLLDDLSADARRLNAVNTVVFKDGRRVGHNTDWSGFAKSFRRGLGNSPLQKVVQAGAGGAGAAVAYALLELGAEALTLHDVERQRAQDLAAMLGSLFAEAHVAVADELPAALSAADGFVNATPVGMAKHPGIPLPPGLLRREMWVADVVYVPLHTQLLMEARECGCRTLDGGGMAVFQAAEAFRLFTGTAPDVERMRERFLAGVEPKPAPHRVSGGHANRRL